MSKGTYRCSSFEQLGSLYAEAVKHFGKENVKARDLTLFVG